MLKIFDREKTFRGVKKQASSSRSAMSDYAAETLGSGDLSKAVLCPPDEDPCVGLRTSGRGLPLTRAPSSREWLAVR